MKKTIVNKTGKFLFPTAMAAAGLTLSAATSQAQMVQNNDVNVTPSAIYSGSAGTVSFSQLANFNTPPQTGTILSDVFNPGSGLTDPTGYTGITFAYQVSETGNDFVDTMSLGGFGSLSSVYVEYANSGFSAPTTVNFFNGILTIDFNPNAVLTGSKSDLIYVFTTANSYNVNVATADDGVSANTQDLAPVPEASTVMAGALMLLPLGIGAVRAIRKERTV